MIESPLLQLSYEVPIVTFYSGILKNYLLGADAAAEMVRRPQQKSIQKAVSFRCVLGIKQGNRMATSVRDRAETVLLSLYEQSVIATDNVLDKSDFKPHLMGLFGEVGGIMSTAKKLKRENEYRGFLEAAEEEFGDTLWYFTAVCLRTKVAIEDVFAAVSKGDGFSHQCAASDAVSGAIAMVSRRSAEADKDAALFDLGRHAASLLTVDEDADAWFQKLKSFAARYMHGLQACNLSFAKVVHHNMRKTKSAFGEWDYSTLDTFDAAFEPEEQIPWDFKIKFSERASGKTYLSMSGVFLGDPLTDAIADPDGYRYHDVFHLAYAAILHWSPVFRALLKQKRKSDPDFDTPQDGGRALVVEEGISAFIFSRAKYLNYFEGHNRVSFDILKAVEHFVSGYEVDRVPLKLWSKAIIDGFAVFRQLCEQKGGYVIGDRRLRTITFMPLESLAESKKT